MNSLNETVYDAVVVGLGPGGATAARALAEAGLSVLALDQARFPRYKPCGGCLSAKIDRILDHDFHDVAERVIHGVSFRLGDGNTLHVRSEAPVAYMVMRDRFDHFLLEKLKKTGAVVKEGERVIQVSENETGIRVQTAGSRYRARFLVGADGVNGLVRRQLPFGALPLKAVLIEGEVGTREMTVHGLEDEALIEFGRIPYGYGWIFPKTDHLSIGVGGIGPTAKKVKQTYRTFFDRYDIFGEKEEKRPYGYSLPIWIKEQPVTTRRTLLIGDAAGLVDPFIGEGIYYAVRSAQIAAKTLISNPDPEKPDLSLYPETLAEEIYPEFSTARKISIFVQLFPKLFQIGLERNTDFLRHYFDVLRAEASYEDFWKQGKQGFVRDLKRLVSKPKKAKDEMPHEDAAELWSRFLGKGAWKHFEAQVSEIIRPDSLVLDGGGAGHLLEQLLENERPVSLSGDLPESFRNGTMTRLPYEDKRFDLAVSAWSLEQMKHPKKVVSEFLRVIKTEGYVICLFSNLPRKGIGKTLGRLINQAVSEKGSSPLDAKEEAPYHNCPRSSIATFAKGLITVTVLRKCCEVADVVTPHAPEEKA